MTPLDNSRHYDTRYDSEYIDFSPHGDLTPQQTRSYLLFLAKSHVEDSIAMGIFGDHPDDIAAGKELLSDIGRAEMLNAAGIDDPETNQLIRQQLRDFLETIEQIAWDINEAIEDLRGGMSVAVAEPASVKVSGNAPSLSVARTVATHADAVVVAA